ncbi:MAG TPA: enoyl-CoA hydratase-related protein [Variovorax sp.]|nr:enoyl-CoA hydratase-related protein [Variovorax sp.]
MMKYPEKSEEGPVLCWRDGAVAHLRFNRPQALNAIDVAMASAFLGACEAIAVDPKVRAVWISGEGRAFMAGGDIAAMGSNPVGVAEELIAGMHGGLRFLAELDAPVVASVQGAVAGGGLGLLLGGADLIVAADGTRFGVAYPLIGASCDCSTSWSLPRIVGLHRALELALLADNIDAAEAQRLGLCNRVVPAAELESETRRLVDRVAAGPTLAYGRLRRLIRESHNASFREQLDAEALCFRQCAATRDFSEGAAAFLEKRRPSFEGR